MHIHANAGYLPFCVNPAERNPNLIRTWSSKNITASEYFQAAQENNIRANRENWTTRPFSSYHQHIGTHRNLGLHVHFYRMSIHNSALPLSRFPGSPPAVLDDRPCFPQGFRDFQPKGTEPYLFSNPASTITTSLPFISGCQPRIQ